MFSLRLYSLKNIISLNFHINRWLLMEPVAFFYLTNIIAFSWVVRTNRTTGIIAVRGGWLQKLLDSLSCSNR